MPNFRVELSYDGTLFHGWQIQPGLRTVQAEISTALERIAGQPVSVHGSGRTDAGVHALGQVASFHLPAALPPANLCRALNAFLAPDLRVLAASVAPDEFHARRSARAKLYRYRIYRGRVLPPFLRHYVYHYPFPLEEAALPAVAAQFAGEHDFTSFATGRLPAAGAVRTVFSSRVWRQDQELIFEIEGSGFLHHMVRNLAGFLLETGLGLRTAADWPRVLAQRERRHAGRTLPARGLYLVAVRYPEEAWNRPESSREN